MDTVIARHPLAKAKARLATGAMVKALVSPPTRRLRSGSSVVAVAIIGSAMSLRARSRPGRRRPIAADARSERGLGVGVDGWKRETSRVRRREPGGSTVSPMDWSAVAFTEFHASPVPGSSAERLAWKAAARLRAVLSPESASPRKHRAGADDNPGCSLNAKYERRPQRVLTIWVVSR